LISYFEISGQIIECDITSHSSSTSMVSAAERPERGRIAARSQASSMPQTSPARPRAGIFRETQSFLWDFYTIPFRNFRPWDLKSPLGAGLRNARDQQERILEYHEYLSN
jgi:hypothetical protein